MAQQRLARRRLPDHVVLDQPQAREAGERGAERGVALGQHGGGERPVGLPDVAELARAVGRRRRRVVVDLVGREAGLPLVREAAVEALAHALDLVGVEALLDDEEAVAPVRLDLLRRGQHGRIREPPGLLPRSAHQPRDQALELARRVVGEAGVHRRALDDRARRRDEPVEALGRRAARRSGPRLRIAGRDPARARRGGRAPPRGRRRARARAARASSSATRAARKRRGRQNSTTPAFTHSPRSTRGTTRTIAYWNGLGGTARLLGLGGEPARRLEPAAQVLRVLGARAAGRTSRRAPRPSTRSTTARSSRGASRASAAAMSPAHGSSTWLRIAGNGRRASAGGSSHACCR